MASRRSKKRAKSNGKPAQQEGVKLASGKVSFDFIKGNFYRPIHVDGAFGGLGPTSRTIHMAVYSERRAIPTQVTHPVTDGQLGDELRSERKERAAFIREVEANLILDLPAAVSIRNWLDQRILDLAKHLEMTGEIKTMTVERSDDA